MKFFRLGVGIFLLCVLLFSIVYALVPEQKLVSKTLDKYKVVVYNSKSTVIDRQIVWCSTNKECSTLAEAGYYEARNQDNDGVIAVMRVIINRVEHEKWPDSVKDVVYLRCQFSYVCDGSIDKAEYDVEQWNRMYNLAYRVLVEDEGRNRYGNATHYHTKQVKPYWSKKWERVALLGDHYFYKCSGYC